MSTTTEGRRRGVLEDSESVLRQVSGALEDMGLEPAVQDDRPEADSGGGAGARLPRLAGTLIKAYVEINSLIEMLRDSRSVLEKAALHRLSRTNEHLHEVTSATESAASDILDVVDDTLGLVDVLMEDRKDDDKSEGTADQIRDRLHQMVMLLQFQDITSQQLGYASSVLVDLEDRLARISAVFGDDCFSEVEKQEIEQELEEARNSQVTCDPEASLGDAEARQSLADSIFG